MGRTAIGVMTLMLAACASSQGRADIATPASLPRSSTIQALYESGDDREILNRVKNSVPASVTSDGSLVRRPESAATRTAERCAQRPCGADPDRR